MVFQNYALYPHMTVAENMGFSLTLQKADKKEIALQVDRAASILGLESLKDRYPRQLSGGQRQRVAMGRAIVRNPKVFLFDEPLSNLDAKLRVQMRAEIRQLHQRLRTTTIYVTHDQIEALTMADKVVVMNGGHIEQMGAPLDLYDNPATLFVAGFIGSPSMNFLTGQLSAAESGLFRTDTGLVFPVGPVSADLDGRKVVVGFRPESVEIDKTGLQVEVIISEPTGSETHVTGKLDGQQITLVYKDRLTPSSGEHLGIRIAPESIHLFDAASGLRLSRSVQVLNLIGEVAS
jgi:multiple sugar transport system ATP-binding protein